MVWLFDGIIQLITFERPINSFVFWHTPIWLHHWFDHWFQHNPIVDSAVSISELIMRLLMHHSIPWMRINWPSASSIFRYKYAIVQLCYSARVENKSALPSSFLLSLLLHPRAVTPRGLRRAATPGDPSRHFIRYHILTIVIMWPSSHQCRQLST